MKESQVVEVFAAWLVTQGWAVRREVEDCDLVAFREGRELRVEVKGDTSSKGVDADTAYGQLLRRMVDDPSVSYAIAAPASCARALARVPMYVRRRLQVTLFAVAEGGSVTELVAPVRADFEAGLTALFRARQIHGARAVRVRAGDLHEQVGGYPGPDHRMPICCAVMREAMRPGDREVEAPPSGLGASLVIEYAVPRRS